MNPLPAGTFESIIFSFSRLVRCVSVLEGSFDVDLFITLCFCGYCFLGSVVLVMFES